MQQKIAVQALSALAQEHRLSVFRLLVRAGPDGMPAGEIAREIGLAPAALSFHLRELDRSGLVTQARDGRFIRYSVAFERMRELLTFLTIDCCQGLAEGCGIEDVQAPLDCDEPTPQSRKKSATRSKISPAEKTSAAAGTTSGELVDD